MPQSLVQNYIHFVFSTKNLVPLIIPKFEEQIFGYVSGVCKNQESSALKIGGHLNHIHILCSRKFLLARWIWCVFSKPKSCRSTKTIYCKST